MPGEPHDLVREGMACAGYLLALRAHWLLTNKDRRGWRYGLASNATWLVVGYYDGFATMFVFTLVWAWINVRGILRWRSLDAEREREVGLGS